MTAEQLVFRNLRPYEKLFVAAIFAWAAWGPVPRTPQASLGRLRLADWPRFVPRPAWTQWRSESARV